MKLRLGPVCLIPPSSWGPRQSLIGFFVIMLLNYFSSILYTGWACWIWKSQIRSGLSVSTTSRVGIFPSDLRGQWQWKCRQTRNTVWNCLPALGTRYTGNRFHVYTWVPSQDGSFQIRNNKLAHGIIQYTHFCTGLFNGQWFGDSFVLLSASVFTHCYL